MPLPSKGKKRGRGDHVWGGEPVVQVCSWGELGGKRKGLVGRSMEHALCARLKPN